MTQQNFINEINERLVAAYHPLAIYLHGHPEWGISDDAGDIELAIVVEAAKEPRRLDRVMPGYDALFELPIGKIIYVYTQEEFDAFLDDPTTFAYTAKTRGKKIYAKA